MSNDLKSCRQIIVLIYISHILDSEERVEWRGEIEYGEERIKTVEGRDRRDKRGLVGEKERS